MTKRPKKRKKQTRSLLLFQIIIVAISCFIIFNLQSTESVKVTANVINVRETPTKESKIITQKKVGDQLTVIGEKNLWYEVKLSNHRTGWIASWLVDDTTKGSQLNKTAFITKDTPLYESDYKSSVAITTLKEGQTIKIKQESHGWYFIEVNQQFGWIPYNTASDLAQTENKVKLALSKQNLKNKVLYVRQANTKLRSAPSTDGQIIETLESGAKVTVLKDKSNGWYYVQSALGEKGYIANWLLSKENLAQSDKKVNKLSKATIVLDAGHGGQDSGSVSQDDRYEKDATLQTTKAVQKALEAKGAKVIMTRDDDTFVGLAERAKISNKNKADAFICIHFDSTQSHNQASGTTTYYYHNNSIELADALNNEIAKLPLPNRGVEFGDHQVTRDNNSPAVLLELGYMSTDTDVKYIFSKSYQEQIANAITKGLTNYFEGKVVVNTQSSSSQMIQ